jgi:hypothetical protein
MKSNTNAEQELQARRSLIDELKAKYAAGDLAIDPAAVASKLVDAHLESGLSDREDERPVDPLSAGAGSD